MQLIVAQQCITQGIRVEAVFSSLHALGQTQTETEIWAVSMIIPIKEGEQFIAVSLDNLLSFNCINLSQNFLKSKFHKKCFHRHKTTNVRLTYSSTFLNVFSAAFCSVMSTAV